MGKGETIGGALGGILGYFWGKTLVINQYMSAVANENPNLTDEVMEGVRNAFVNENLWAAFGCSWAALRRSRAALWQFLAALGSFVAALGPLLVALWMLSAALVCS